MIAIKNDDYYDRLKKRRDEILLTLAHVQKEQRAVDENKDWIDQAAFESRIDLLCDLTDWYLKETARIDDALTRIAEGKYGICLACHEPIERRRLDTTPAAAFCVECQRTRENLIDL